MQYDTKYQMDIELDAALKNWETAKASIPMFENIDIAHIANALQPPITPHELWDVCFEGEVDLVTDAEMIALVRDYRIRKEEERNFARLRAEQERYTKFAAERRAMFEDYPPETTYGDIVSGKAKKISE